MSLAIARATPGAAVAHWQAAFLDLLPTIRTVARRHFRHVRCPDRRQDRLCEAVAIAWARYCRLRRTGRDPAGFVVTFATLAARAANSGRRLCGQERARDALSPTCQRRRNFVAAPLPDGSAEVGNVFDEALRDNTLSPVPDQVQFRCDFPVWAGRLPEAKRRVVEYLALGHRTRDAAAVFGVTPGRISQRRREFYEGYGEFLTGASVG